MTVYDWLSLFGVPTLFTAIIAYVIQILKKNDIETKAIKLGVQALLRDRLIQAYYYHARKGYVDFDDRKNWENIYKQYHNLGVNGVMDDIHKKFLALPVNKPVEEK